MKIISSVSEMQQTALAMKRQGQSIAFVPTMGYLHDGHASLLREGRKLGDVLVLSIFVNPAQFAPNEDLSRYPRDMERDCVIAADSGVDIVFTPDAGSMYRPGAQTVVSVRELTKPLCGASRPGHFDGVATVVAKLFNIVQPDTALFGKKDFQQLAVIRRMTADLDMPVRVVGMPIVREPDGLAMSSRNVYLSNSERSSALALSRAIVAVRNEYRNGGRDVERLQKIASDIIGAEPAITIDYLEFRHSETLETALMADDATLMALAAKIGTTRLIDNTIMGEEL